MIALLIVASGATGTVEVPGCATPAQWAVSMAESNPGSTSKQMRSDNAKLFMEAYNAMPPTTDVPADEVLLLENPRIRSVFIIFFKAGCMIAMDRLSPQTIETIMRRAFPGQNI